MFELEQAFVELRNVLIQQSLIIFKFLGIIWAIWRTSIGGINYLQGDKQAIGKTLFQIIVGMAVILMANNFVYIIVEFFEKMSDTMPTFGG